MRLVVFAVALLVATSCTDSEGDLAETPASELAETPASEQEEIDTLRARAEQGDAEAQFELGVMYDTGEGVLQDYAEAVSWYRLAAEQRLADAQRNLGFMYAQGRGVPQDDAEAVRWFRLAAAQRNARTGIRLLS